METNKLKALGESLATMQFRLYLRPMGGHRTEAAPWNEAEETLVIRATLMPKPGYHQSRSYFPIARLAQHQSKNEAGSTRWQTNWGENLESMLQAIGMLGRSHYSIKETTETEEHPAGCGCAGESSPTRESGYGSNWPNYLFGRREQVHRLYRGEPARKSRWHYEPGGEED